MPPAVDKISEGRRSNGHISLFRHMAALLHAWITNVHQLQHDGTQAQDNMDPIHNEKGNTAPTNNQKASICCRYHHDVPSVAPAATKFGSNGFQSRQVSGALLSSTRKTGCILSTVRSPLPVSVPFFTPSPSLCPSPNVDPTLGCTADAGRALISSG